MSYSGHSYALSYLNNNEIFSRRLLSSSSMLFIFCYGCAEPTWRSLFYTLHRRLLLLLLFGMWVNKLHFHQLSKPEPREMGNGIKMSLDTLIDFNCSVAHFMEVVVGVNHIGHHHRHRCNDNKHNNEISNAYIARDATSCAGEWRPDAGSIATYRCGRLDQNTIWLFNLCVSLVSPLFHSLSFHQASAFYRRAINNVTIHFHWAT